MKTNILKPSVIVLLLTMGFVSCTQDFKEEIISPEAITRGADDVGTEVDFLYAESGEKKYFNISDNKVIIKANSTIEARKLAQYPILLSTHYVGDIWMLAIIDSEKTKIEDLLQLPGVADATYGLEYSDGTVKYPTDVIYINSERETSIEKSLGEVELAKSVKAINLFNPYSKGYNVKLDIKLGDVVKICRKLSESGLHKGAEPSSFIELKHHNTHYADQWNLRYTGQYGATVSINAESAWAITRGNSSIKVAVIDEGVDLGHTDLQANLLQGYDAVPSTYNPGGANGSPYANNAHGTACAGIIGAINNTVGVVGVASGSKVIPIRIAYDLEDGWGWVTHEDWVANGIHYAWHDAQADVLSNSWGGSSSTKITNAINDAVTQGRSGKGCVVVFASGNDNLSTVSYPARLSEVIAVGAVSLNGQRKSPSSPDGENWGSNYGLDLDVVAPGVLIPTTDIRNSAGYNPNAPIHTNNGGNKRSSDYTDQNYTVWFNGTSAAAPQVSGIAALILSVKPNLMHYQVADIITGTAGNLSWNNQTGYGLVNAYDAVSLATSTATPTITSITASPSTSVPRGGYVTFEATGSPGSQYEWETVSGAEYPGNTAFGENLYQEQASSALLSKPFLNVRCRAVRNGSYSNWVNKIVTIRQDIALSPTP